MLLLDGEFSLPSCLSWTITNVCVHRGDQREDATYPHIVRYEDKQRLHTKPKKAENNQFPHRLGHSSGNRTGKQCSRYGHQCELKARNIKRRFSISKTNKEDIIFNSTHLECEQASNLWTCRSLKEKKKERERERMCRLTLACYSALSWGSELRWMSNSVIWLGTKAI